MVIAVASGKGGTGKTMVTTALALSVDECTYIDLDVEEPNGELFLKPDIREELTYNVPVPTINKEKCTYCGRCAKACAYNALAVVPMLKKSMLFPELCHSCGVCGFVCPEKGAIQESRREIGKIRRGSRGSIEFIEGRLKVGQPSAVPLISGITTQFIADQRDRLFLLDSSPGTACPVVEILKKCDFVILVTEPTLFGLNDLELTVELVQAMGKKAGIIINKDEEGQNLITQFSQRVQLPILLRIPYSLKIQEAYSRGIPLTELYPEMKGRLKELITRITGSQ
ncbi:MAG: ATP-binding protein [Acidobacteria bacterium]|jgi:MinD superfamily P-loop ATPase|nr:ATP-binding protein [Acidobacteriota bacterium]